MAINTFGQDISQAGGSVVPTVQPAQVATTGSLDNTLTTPTAPTTTPTVSPSSTATPAVGAAVPPGPGLDPTSFLNVVNGVKQNFAANNDLINQKNLLIKGLFTSPLTPDQVQQLPPDIQQVWNSGNKDAIQLQLQALNEKIQGSTNNFASSVNYLVNGYNTSVAEADKKRQEATAAVQNFVQQYGSRAPEALKSLYGQPYLDTLKQMGIDINSFASVPTLEETKQNTTSTGPSNIATDNERALFSQFNSEPIVKDYNTILSKKLSVDSILDSKIGGPGDLAVVYEFMKGLDPTSVVRETEYDSAAKSGNIFAGAFAKFNGYLKPDGGFLPDSVKKDFQSIVNSKLKVQTQLYDNTKKQYEDLASRQGLNPQNVVIDYSAANKPSDSTDAPSKFADIEQYITVDGDKAYIPRNVWSTLGSRMDDLIAEAKADGKTLLIKD